MNFMSETESQICSLCGSPGHQTGACFEMPAPQEQPEQPGDAATRAFGDRMSQRERSFMERLRGSARELAFILTLATGTLAGDVAFAKKPPPEKGRPVAALVEKGGRPVDLRDRQATRQEEKFKIVLSEGAIEEIKKQELELTSRHLRGLIDKSKDLVDPARYEALQFDGEVNGVTTLSIGIEVGEGGGLILTGLNSDGSRDVIIIRDSQIAESRNFQK